MARTRKAPRTSLSVTACSPRVCRNVAMSDVELTTVYGHFYPEETAEYRHGTIPLLTGCLEAGVTAVPDPTVWDLDALPSEYDSPEDELLAWEDDVDREDLERPWFIEDLAAEYDDAFFDEDFETQRHDVVDRYEHLDDLRPTRIGVRKANRTEPKYVLRFNGYRLPTSGKERSFFQRRHLHRRSLEAERAE